ncbi:hypothetical protein EVAR_50866_1 [Eumeta japonica]|uniref:Uncharacterized protein n=1 Tax=Eumeta variegata TaxID=151549 RepID=A0A4C1Y5H6_EUMVA|nr:hypothetical protein EVAR_50866_1 [Eumeta japonica]
MNPVTPRLARHSPAGHRASRGRRRRDSGAGPFPAASSYRFRVRADSSRRPAAARRSSCALQMLMSRTLNLESRVSSRSESSPLRTSSGEALAAGGGRDGDRFLGSSRRPPICIHLVIVH